MGSWVSYPRGGVSRPEGWVSRNEGFSPSEGLLLLQLWL